MLQQHRIAAAAHGFRSSFRDWLAKETDHPREVILIGARLSYPDAHFVGVFAYRTEGDLVAAFTATALPTEPVRVTKLVEDDAFVRVCTPDLIEKTLNIPEDTLMTFTAALGVEETLVRLITYGAQASDTVGGPST